MLFNILHRGCRSSIAFPVLQVGMIDNLLLDRRGARTKCSGAAQIFIADRTIVYDLSLSVLNELARYLSELDCLATK